MIYSANINIVGTVNIKCILFAIGYKTIRFDNISKFNTINILSFVFLYFIIDNIIKKDKIAKYSRIINGSFFIKLIIEKLFVKFDIPNNV